jgi:predicted RNA-binding protein with PUA-like domain
VFFCQKIIFYLGFGDMKYWLFKSEPSSYSIDDLQRDRVEPWDGIRNFQARNFIRDEMEKGDEILFYHSSTNPTAIVGTAVVDSPPYPDPTQFDPKNNHFDPKSKLENPTWYLVDVRFVSKAKTPLTLEGVKNIPELAEIRLIQKGSRLSVFPVSKEHYEYIEKLLKS